MTTGIILCICPANERWRYIVTSSLIGGTHTQIDPYDHMVWPGGRLNKKDGLTGYGDPHVKDKTSYRPSYL